jgi:hypothetical protein
MKQFFFSILLVFMASTAVAQDDPVLFNLGDDTFLAGPDVVLDAQGRDDIFVAGKMLAVVSDVTGSAHAAGRVVALKGKIGQDVYAAGYTVTLTGAVAGDASVLGYEVWFGGAIGGDLRATGTNVTLAAPVAGYAVIAAETVTLNSAIAGDVSIFAEDIVFGPDARISGKLTLYEDDADPRDVPAYVISGDRTERQAVEEWEAFADGQYAPFSLRQAASNFIYGVITIAVIAGIIAAVAPQHLKNMRVQLLAAPFRTIWFGFLFLSVLIGSSVLLALTLVGIIVAPVAIFLALLGAFLGYVVGSYALGVGLLMAAGRNPPKDLVERVAAAFIGALIVGLIGLIPVLGWIFVFALTLAGAGAITTRIFRPTFFAPV